MENRRGDQPECPEALAEAAADWLIGQSNAIV